MIGETLNEILSGLGYGVQDLEVPGRKTITRDGVVVLGLEDVTANDVWEWLKKAGHVKPCRARNRKLKRKVKCLLGRGHGGLHRGRTTRFRDGVFSEQKVGWK